MLTALFERLRARPRASRSPSQAGGAVPLPVAPLAPFEALCLVGDLHGAAPLLARLLALRAARFPNARLVFLGDMLDRGPQSAEVLARVQAEVAQGAVALMGNHEAMCLSFLDAPTQGHAWLRHGGAETLASFGLNPFDTDVVALRDAFRARLGPAAEAWLRGLPHVFASGNLVAAHAGLAPDRPPEAQAAQDLLWGHPAFFKTPRQDGLWVAHGHYMGPEAYVRGARLSLDSGAYASGRLSFALVDPALPQGERLMISAVM